MFVEQEKKPTVAKNTGVCYWLELKRNNKITRVTNKTDFQSGDKLRIHVKPNVNGFAYVLMMQGSQGDKDILFPDKESGSNQVKAGTWMTLPAGKETDDWLKFDDEPGTELLRMIVSRTKIDPKEYLNESAVVLAEDNKDEVPEGTMVSITVSKNATLKASGLRNLVVEKETKPQTEGETTVVGAANKPLAVDIALNHKSKAK